MDQRVEDWQLCDDVRKLPFVAWYFTTATAHIYDIDLFDKTHKGGVLTPHINVYYTGINKTGNTLPKPVSSSISPENSISIMHIQRLPHKTLINPLDVIVEPDDDGFLARTPDFPLYGYGKDRMEAIEMLKREIESLYEDLMEDDNFSEEWINIKRFLTETIID